jgi:hypothetical protein
MANKSQTLIRRLIQKAFHKKESEVRISCPTHAYHNFQSGAWATRTIPLIKYIHKAKSKPFPKGSSDGMSVLKQRKFLAY